MTGTFGGSPLPDSMIATTIKYTGSHHLCFADQKAALVLPFLMFLA